jgi:hypothetical protein
VLPALLDRLLEKGELATLPQEALVAGGLGPLFGNRAALREPCERPGGALEGAGYGRHG